MKPILDGLASLLMAVAAGLVIWTFWPTQRQAPSGPTIALPAEPLSITEFPRVGRPDANAVLIEFSDFECPYCSRFSTEVLPVLKAKYIDSGQLQLVFRHLPLSQIHRSAENAAQTAHCAFKQGRFLPMHDLLFSHSSSLSADRITSLAGEAGLNQA